jgi:DNA-binding transcriptional ArsR family regulator
LRHDILDRLVATGPCSVREFCDAVGLAPSAVYHHLRRLEAAGLVVETGTRVVNRRTERLYAPRAPRMRLSRALGRPALAPSIGRVVTALTKQMRRDFSHGSRSPHARVRGPRRNLGLFRLVGSPDRAALAEINRHLDRIAELLWTEQHDHDSSIALAWTLAPVGKPRRTPTRRKRS